MNQRYQDISEKCFETLLSIDFVPGQGLYQDTHALLIWQYVRFNSTYKEDFRQVQLQEQLIGVDAYEREAFHLARKWCMSELIDPKEEFLPTNFAFSSESVFDFTSEELNSLSHEALKIILPMRNSANPIVKKALGPIFVAVNPAAQVSRIKEDIEALVKSERARFGFDEAIDNTPLDALFKQYSLRGSVTAKSRGHHDPMESLVGNLILFKIKELDGTTSPKDVSQEYYKYFSVSSQGNELQSKQITDRINSFKKWSEHAPWCFFVSPS